MNNDADTEMTWEILDQDTVQTLVERKGATALIDDLNSASPSPRDRADHLVSLAISGKISSLKKETSEFCDWAAEHGTRRIENTLIELDRVLALPKRGEALLHAQALTRFIVRNIDADIKVLKTAIKGNS